MLNILSIFSKISEPDLKVQCNHMYMYSHWSSERPHFIGILVVVITNAIRVHARHIISAGIVAAVICHLPALCPGSHSSPTLPHTYSHTHIHMEFYDDHLRETKLKPYENLYIFRGAKTNDSLKGIKRRRRRRRNVHGIRLLEMKRMKYAKGMLEDWRSPLRIVFHFLDYFALVLVFISPFFYLLQIAI